MTGPFLFGLCFVAWLIFGPIGVVVLLAIIYVPPLLLIGYLMLKALMRKMWIID